MGIGNNWKVGSSKSQLTSLSLAPGTNARGLYSLAYVWKEKLLTGGKLTRISTHPRLKYKLEFSYTVETITAPIGHTWRCMNLGRLDPYRTTSMRLID